MSDLKHRIGITLGDPHGIGPEVVMKALDDSKLLSLITPVLYGCDRVLSFYKKRMPSVNFDYNCVEKGLFHPSLINLVDCLVEPFEIMPGKASKQSATAARTFLYKALKDAKEGVIDGLVTGPIDKSTIYENTFPYRGHTEYLAHAFNTTERLMIMVGNMLKVALTTMHIPVENIVTEITHERIASKIDFFEYSLRYDFKIAQPRIAVLGLNPHAGDEGLIGMEDRDVIAPIVQDLYRKGKKIFGPFAADGFFASKKYEQYDGVLAMYHDQGLIPFKLLAFNHGVNYTAGLPIVRTAPAHGVAYDIAGKNVADENATRQAIYLATSISKHRLQADAIP